MLHCHELYVYTFVCKTFVTGRYETTSDAKVLLHFKHETLLPM